MTTIANVLCPIDLSEVSRLALRYAVAVARAHDARLRVLQVVESGLPPMANGPALFELSADARASLDEELNWFVAPVLHADVPTEVHLREGKVVATILDEAATLTAPLIVIGTHGRGGFERFALGSVAEKVLRKASCPVLAVPPHATPADGFRRVLVATDFSAPSERALSFAELVAVPSSANLFLVHVLEWPFGDTSGPDPVTALRQSLEAEAADRLTALAAACRARLAERVVLRGKPSREIVEFARARQIDLIVLGVSGRGAVNLALLGSTARQVLHDAPCPVLTVTM